MIFTLICTDNPGAQELRKSTREAHLAYVAETGVVRRAGPFLDARGEMNGSLVFIEVADLADAEDWAANDPYARAGLFSSVDIRAWKQTVGD
jgi:uncharacterized protein